MTFGTYCFLVSIVVVLYLLGISLHVEVKNAFDDIKIEIARRTTRMKTSRASYPFFLAQRRAATVHWMINGLFSIVALVALFLWFLITVPKAYAAGIRLSQEIDVIDVFGPFAVVQPFLLLIAVLVLLVYWIEVQAFDRWRTTPDAQPGGAGDAAR